MTSLNSLFLSPIERRGKGDEVETFKQSKRALEQGEFATGTGKLPLANTVI